MSRRSLILLIVATVLVTAAAIWASVRQERGVEARFTPGPLFPALADRADAIAQIDVTTRNTALRVKRDGQRWVVASQDDYPAKPDLVRRTIFALIDAKMTDRATALPENHRKIGLIAPDQGGSATRVLLLDAAGSQLAALLIGNPVASDAPDVGPQSYFVRKLGDNQAWIAQGDFPVEPDVRAWLDPEIAVVERARIQSTTVAFPDGATYAVSRKAPDQPDFVIRAVPAGREPAPVTDIANALGNAPSNLSFDDVRARAKADFPAKAEHVVYRTFDGLVLDVALAKRDDGGTWATFAASLDETIVPASAPPAPNAPGAEKAAPPAANPVKPPLHGPDAVRKEVETINARTAGWVYRLPASLTTDLTHPMEDLLAPKKAVAPAKAGTAKKKTQPAAKPKSRAKSKASAKKPAKQAKPRSAVSAPAH